jgi:hypothetical protein
MIVSVLLCGLMGAWAVAAVLINEGEGAARRAQRRPADGPSAREPSARR